MFPAAQLYTREVAYAISHCQRLGTPFKLDGDLRQEGSLVFPGFVDWMCPLAHRRAQSCKALSLGCFAVPLGRNPISPGGVETAGDYLSDDLGNKDIAVKEAFALLSVLQAFSLHLNNTRVDVLVDNI